MSGSTKVPDDPGSAPRYGPVQRYARPPAERRPATAPDSAPPPAQLGPPGPSAWPPPSSAPQPTPVQVPAAAAPAWGPAPPWGPGPAWGPTPPWGPGPHWSPPRRSDYASWSRRVAGAAVDSAPGWVAVVLVTIAYLPVYLGLFHGDVTVAPRQPFYVLGMLLDVAAFGWAVYNRYFLAGRTGQSIGKRATKTWLVSRTTGRPIGALDAFVRDLLHILDGLGYLGYLWPLWDDEHQTLADKVAQTIVVRTPVAPLTALERRAG